MINGSASKLDDKNLNGSACQLTIPCLVNSLCKQKSCSFSSYTISDWSRFPVCLYVCLCVYVKIVL